MKKHLAAWMAVGIAAWTAGGCGSRASLLDAGDFGADGDTAGANGATSGNGTSGATGTASQGAGGTTTSGGSQSSGQGGASNGAGNGSGPGSGPGSSGNGSGPGSSGNGGAPNGSSGSGGMVCPSFGGPCPDCISQVCPEVWCGCVQNPECVALFQCAGNCNPGDETCQQACMTAHQDGIPDVLLVSDCAGSACDGSCTWGNDVPPCTECILADCSDEMNACLAQPECLQLFNCLNGCDNIDSACQQGCYDDHGAGVPTLQLVLECADSECQQRCPN